MKGDCLVPLTATLPLVDARFLQTLSLTCRLIPTVSSFSFAALRILVPSRSWAEPFLSIVLGLTVSFAQKLTSDPGSHSSLFDVPTQPINHCSATPLTSFPVVAFRSDPLLLTLGHHVSKKVTP